MINYPAGDFLIRIKNASLARRKEVVLKNTKLIKSIALALKKQGYLEEVKEEEGRLYVKLAYHKKKPVLLDLKLISRPGLRVYMDVNELEKIRKPSIFILSTPKGIVSSYEAIKKRVGGEVIVEIW